MYTRNISLPARESCFLFGPRGTGKSHWVQTQLPDSIYIDLLEAEQFNRLMASPDRLEGKIPSSFSGTVVIDEVQKIPALLDEVHRLIEKRPSIRFVLTGSSARKLRRAGVNLLAGRALTHHLYPLTRDELGSDFDFKRSLKYGHLPKAYRSQSPKTFLSSYVQTYLKEEIQQEGLTRNIGAFARFLEAASFSQAAPLNISAVAKDCSVDRKVVENYFSILRDLLLSYELPVFSKKAKRKLIHRSKFFFFDVGVFRSIRPKGPLDSVAEIDGAALETLVLQELMAQNAYESLGYQFYHWRSQAGREVDLVLYGERGLHAIEVKRTSRVRNQDLKGLQTFLKDYPVAKAYFVYSGERAYHENGIDFIPIESFLSSFPGER